MLEAMNIPVIVLLYTTKNVATQIKGLTVIQTGFHQGQHDIHSKVVR